MAVRLSPRFAVWPLLSVLACSERSPTEPVPAAGSGAQTERAAERPHRSAARVVAPRASAVPLQGAWGGDHVGLTITSDTVAIEFDCAAGSIDGPFIADSDGRFSLIGSWWFTPPVLDQHWQPEKRPTRYSGVVKDGTMTLTVIRLDDNQFLGSFLLALNQTPGVLRCV